MTRTSLSYNRNSLSFSLKQIGVIDHEAAFHYQAVELCEQLQRLRVGCSRRPSPKDFVSNGQVQTYYPIFEEPNSVGFY